MAIVWGANARGNSSNEFAVGIDLSVSGTTITASYYVWSKYSVADGMTLTMTGAITGSTSFQMVQGSSGGSQLVTTQTMTGTLGTSYSFGASVSGIYNGASPYVSGVSITVPAQPPSKPATPTISNPTSNSLRGNLASAPASNGASIIKYWWETEDAGGTRKGFYSTDLTVNLTDLLPNTVYWVRVQAGNSAGWGPQSDWSNPATTEPLAPNAPGTPSVSRTSDTRHTVSWTQNATTDRPYASQQVQRRTWTNSGGWGNWATIATVSATTTSFADTGTIADRGYRYRIVAVNATGTGTSSESVSVRTTPAAATNLQAVKSGSSIAVTGTEAQQVTPDVTYEWQDNPGGTSWTTVSGTTLSPSRTFTGVNQAVAHQYRTRACIYAQAESGAFLYSEWSSPTDVVQLLAPPLAPSTSTAFNPSLPANRRVAGVVDRDMDVRLPFTHQSVDSSAQLAAEVKWRVDGGAWTTIALTTQAFATVTAPGTSGTLEWQARTKGDHPDFSPWSPVQAAQLVFRTLVTASGPSGLIHTSRAVAEWEIYSADGGQQASWSASLLTDDGTVIEFRSGTGSATRSAAFTTPLVDATSYRVRVEVHGSNQLWSDPDESTFTTDFPLPVPATVEAEWDRDQGATVITLDVPDPSGDFVVADEIDVQWWHEGRREWVTLGTVSPEEALLHRLPYLGENTYRAITRNTSLPTETVGTEYVKEYTHDRCLSYINHGDNFGQVLRGIVSKPTVTPRRETALYEWEGSRWPEAGYGSNRGYTIAGVATLHPRYGASSPREWREALYEAEDVCYRDCGEYHGQDPRRVFGRLTITDQPQNGPHVNTVGFTIDRTNTESNA